MQPHPAGAGQVSAQPFDDHHRPIPPVHHTHGLDGRSHLQDVHRHAPSGLPGVPATGKRATIRVMDFVRFRDGTVSERWNIVDVAGLLQQLGVTPGEGSSAQSPE
jgi:hypothetical protein